MEFGIADGDFVIGTIGRMDPVKNHAGLVEATAPATNRLPALWLAIAGDGPQRSLLEDRGARLLHHRGVASDRLPDRGRTFLRYSRPVRGQFNSWLVYVLATELERRASVLFRWRTTSANSFSCPAVVASQLNCSATRLVAERSG